MIERVEPVFLILLLVATGCTASFGQSRFEGDLTFESQDQLDSFLLYCADCESVSGNVTIEEKGVQEITNLEALHGITSVGGLEIRNNSKLIDLKGLEGLAEVHGGCVISGNSALESLAALQALTSVGESIRISSNRLLEKVASFKNLKVVNGDLSCSDNPRLNNLDGFQNIRNVKGNLIIRGCGRLVSMMGMQGLQSIGGQLLVAENDNLLDLSGLDQLSYIGGDCIVDQHAELISLSGMPQLVTIDGFLQVVNNPRLTSLRGLESLRSISGLLQVYNNNSLETLSGIDSLVDVHIDDLAIIDNPRLDQCNVSSICGFLQANENRHSISGNDEGCNTRKEILDLCQRGGITITPGPNEIVFYPVPTTGLVYFTGSIVNPTLSVADIAGQRLIQEQYDGGAIDLTLLPSGVYLVELHSDRKTIRSSILKL